MSIATIRPATIEDAGRISRLLTELALEYIASEFSERGRRQLLAEFTEPAIAARLASDDYRFHVAEDGAVLAGVVSIRRKTHLYYLFVAKPQQRMGLARRLWLLARDEAIGAGNPAGHFTVNASRYAVGAYERLGFSRAGPVQELQGVRFQPMEWTVSRS